MQVGAVDIYAMHTAYSNLHAVCSDDPRKTQTAQLASYYKIRN